MRANRERERAALLARTVATAREGAEHEAAVVSAVSCEAVASTAAAHTVAAAEGCTSRRLGRLGGHLTPLATGSHLVPRVAAFLRAVISAGRTSSAGSSGRGSRRCGGGALCRVLIRECLCAHRARAELAARPVEAVLALLVKEMVSLVLKTGY